MNRPLTYARGAATATVRERTIHSSAKRYKVRRRRFFEEAPPSKKTMSGREGYFLAFGGTILSLAALATRNLTTVLAGILISSPVAGLRPLRALRLALTSLPIPGKVNAPVFFV